MGGCEGLVAVGRGQYERLVGRKRRGPFEGGSRVTAGHDDLVADAHGRAQGESAQRCTAVHRLALVVEAEVVHRHHARPGEQQRHGRPGGVHGVDIVATSDAGQRELAPQHPHRPEAQAPRAALDDRGGGEAAIVLDVAAPAGDHEVAVEAARECVDVAGCIAVAQARCGRIEQHEHACAAGAVGRPGHAPLSHAEPPGHQYPVARLSTVLIRELAVPGAFEVTPRQFADDRGVFVEWYRFDALTEAVGHPLDLRQGNGSVSRKGVVRGIHFADVPPSQAKYVTVMHGAVLDFVVDIRVGSPTFGQWDSVLLDTVDRRALYIAEGLGHCFVALTDDAAVTYLVSEVFAPQREHGISPLDETVGLDLPFARDELLLSEKDLAAPTLVEAERDGLLPTWHAATAFTRSLDESWAAR